MSFSHVSSRIHNSNINNNNNSIGTNILSVGGFILKPSMISISRTHIFLKCDGGVSKNRPFNRIELFDTNIKNSFDFAHSKFICPQIIHHETMDYSRGCEKMQSIFTAPQIINDNNEIKDNDTIILIKFNFWIHDTKNNKWYILMHSLSDIMNLNIINIGMNHHGRKRTGNPYLSIIMKCIRSEFSIKTKSNKRILSDIYLQVILNHKEHGDFIDYVYMPFKTRKKENKKNNDIISISNTINTDINYNLSEINPSEGNPGDVITLRGLFPPKDRIKIYFGTIEVDINKCIITPKNIQCEVPAILRRETPQNFIDCTVPTNLKHESSQDILCCTVSNDKTGYSVTIIITDKNDIPIQGIQIFKYK